MDHDLKSLVDKLNFPVRRSLEAAAAQCVKQTHYQVEIEHLLLNLLDRPGTDIAAILHAYEVKAEPLIAELDRTLEHLTRGNTRTPSLSQNLIKLLQEAWLCSSLLLGSQVIRSGALLFAMLDHATLRGSITETCPSLRFLPRDTLRRDLREVVRSSDEETTSPRRAGHPAPAASTGDDDPAAAMPSPSTTIPGSALDQFTTDLTAQARAGVLDPIRGRDFEIRQIIDILMRRRQNNPILTGEAGVGKTAIVEGFAQRVAVGDVPPPLRNVAVRILDLALLQAGAGVKGEFESRLKSVISEVQASPQPVILFIDEAHNMIGAGGMAGQGDAANLLKPALARGELRTIAATTWSEYKKYFEKDPALVRRFQVVRVNEPDEEAAVAMLRGVAQKLEAHHGVRILAEALVDTVRLSHRYLSGTYLPDKAIRVLDTACARVAVGQTGTPAEVEGVQREMDLLDTEITHLDRERRAGHPHEERIADLRQKREQALKRYEELSARFTTEREAVAQIRDLVEQLSTAPIDAPSDARIADLTSKRAALSALQGETPMISVAVDSHVVSGVISDWTGVPIRRMQTDEIHAVKSLSDRLAQRVVGQPQALDAICRRIRTSRAGLDDPKKPIGVFLLIGPSGVGKTETAHALAESFYGGGARQLVTINMSEYQEAHMVSLLKGSPPGYVGYGRGGVLTEAVRKNPYSLVLLDEVEKAHSDVLELFYQVFDKGQLEDGEGVLVDFKNTVILLTANIGGEELFALCKDGQRPDPEDVLFSLRPQLLRRFKAALLGRLAVVPYYPLRDEDIAAIVRLKLQRVQQRFRDSHRAELSFSDDLCRAIAARCTEVDSGARNVDAILEKNILPAVSDWILELLARAQPFTSMHVGCGEDGGLVYTVDQQMPAVPPKKKPRSRRKKEVD